jgi:hypothetical protein
MWGLTGGGVVFRLDSTRLATDPCEAAKLVFYVTLGFRVLYSFLLFVVATFFVIAIIQLVIAVSSTPTNALQGIVGGLGTIAGGSALKWVLDRRSEAVKENNEARRSVDTNCSSAQAAALTL